MLPKSIIQSCSKFLIDSNNNPIYKNLPTNGDGFRKVKIRQKSKYSNDIQKCLDIAYQGKFKNLMLRSMIVDTQYPPIHNKNENYEPFYIFLPDSYKIIYNTNIADFEDYMKKLNSISKNVDTMTISQVFSDTYSESENISDIINNKIQGIIYNVKYYFCIRASLVQNYHNFVTN